MESSWVVTRLRMNLIMTSTPATNKNLLLNGDGYNDASESEEEDNMHGFTKMMNVLLEKTISGI